MVGLCMPSFLTHCMCMLSFLAHCMLPSRDAIVASVGAWWGDGLVQPRPAPHEHT